MKQMPIPQMSMTDTSTTDHDAQHARAGALHLHGLLAHWGKLPAKTGSAH